MNLGGNSVVGKILLGILWAMVVVVVFMLSVLLLDLVGWLVWLVIGESEDEIGV